MAAQKKLAFVASDAPIARAAQSALTSQYGGVALEDADIIVALGGDGFMLQTLHNTQHLPAPVYGMNRGTVGFLMNNFSDQGLRKRLEQAEEEVINPGDLRGWQRTPRPCDQRGILAARGATGGEVAHPCGRAAADG